MEAQELTRGELLVNERTIRDEPQRRLRQLRINGDVVAVHDDATRGWFQQPRDHAQRRGLAGTIGSEKTVYLTGLHVEGDVIDCGKPAVLLHEMLDRDHWVFLRSLRERGLSQSRNEQQSAGCCEVAG